ncbi:MAG: hypothetical protein JW791_03620 [Nanoarchaeota archaeon]|nr:hypothetical protein [Nanoarchaeota archaeon]
MKAQIFSPLYTIIFASIIISVMLIFTNIIEEWRLQSLLIIDSKFLETSVNLLQSFDEYFFEYNTSTVLNITVSDYITLSNNGYSASFKNDYNIPDNQVDNVSKLIIQRLNKEWIIT